MKALHAEKLSVLPVAQLSRLRDLIYYDGPLLTEYVNAHGDHYLYYWCDRSDSGHRWMLLRVDETTVLRLVHRFIPLDFVIPCGSRDEFVYFVDSTSEGGISEVWLAKPDDVPDDYRPIAGTFLRDLPRAREAEYPILIEGDWDPVHLMRFPRLFELTYSFLYVVNKLPVDHQFGGFPWRGGYSSMHFNQLIGSIPTESRLGVEAVRYSSPGFMRFSVDYDTAEQVAISVHEFRSQAVQSDIEKLTAYIRAHRLNDIADPNDEKWIAHNDELTQLTTAITDGFTGLNSSHLLAGVDRSFEAAQIARWFCRRIEEISRYELDGMIRLAPVE